MSSLVVPVGIIVASPVLFVALARDRRQRRRRTADRQEGAVGAIRGMAGDLDLVERPLPDPAEAFPPSELGDHHADREIRKDHERRRGATARAWTGHWSDGIGFELFRADRQILISRGSGSSRVIKQHDLVRTRVDSPVLPRAVVLCPQHDFKVGFLGDVGWYIKHPDPTPRPLRTLKVPVLEGHHEAHVEARADTTALARVLEGGLGEWLAGADPRIRYELVDGVLHTFQCAQEDDPPSAPVEELLSVAHHLTRALSVAA